MPLEPVLGALVEVPAGRGTVRFAGATSFSAGKWIGIELFDGHGKNDGTVQGVKYFSCKPNYGVFVRPSQVKVIAPPEPVHAVSVTKLFILHLGANHDLAHSCAGGRPPTHRESFSHSVRPFHPFFSACR